MKDHWDDEKYPQREWLSSLHERLWVEHDWLSLIGERRTTLGPLSLIELHLVCRTLSLNGRQDRLWVLISGRTVLLSGPEEITDGPDGSVSLRGLDERGKWVRLENLELSTVKVYVQVQRGR